MCGFCWCRCCSGFSYPSIDIAAFFSLFYCSFKILGRAIFGINDFPPNFGVTPLILVNLHNKLSLPWLGASFRRSVLMDTLIFACNAAGWFWLWFCHGYWWCSRSRCRGSASGIGFFNKNNRRCKQKNQTNNESSPFS